MPSTVSTSHATRRKAKSGGGVAYLDDDDRIDYANAPLETSQSESSMNNTENGEGGRSSEVDDSPFRDAGAEDVELERHEKAIGEEVRAGRRPRTEAPIEEFLTPARRKGMHH